MRLRLPARHYFDLGYHHLIYIYGEGDTSVSQAIYCFAGIGIRQAAVFPAAGSVGRGTPLELAAGAKLAGIGFAAEENVNYFSNSLGSAVSGRFLTANFLHLALTGLCQGLKWPRTHGANILAIFIAAVTVHGLYNAFIIVDALEECIEEYSKLMATNSLSAIIRTSVIPVVTCLGLQGKGTQTSHLPCKTQLNQPAQPGSVARGRS